ncbi:kinase-like domain-containing protein [Xylariales sp. PMI_506]|nr:kinase-like domain-containing protein [Xylariales sp. PMI_506]
MDRNEHNLIESAQTNLQTLLIPRDLHLKSKEDQTDSRNRFIPQGALRAVITPDRVQALVKCLLDASRQDNEALAHSIAKRISPTEKELCRCEEELCTGSRIIFATLLHISRGDLIIPIFKNKDLEICDKNLPVEDPSTTLNNILPGLSAVEKSLFYHGQNQMRAPIFAAKFSDDGHVRTFADDISLPWTELKLVTDKTADLSTAVQRVSIDPDHHKLSSRRLTLRWFKGKREDKFALKTFTEREKSSFQGEVNSNERVPKHDHIVPLLAAFKHRKQYHLLFPWAHGGSLSDIWEKYPLGNSVDNNQNLAWLSPEWFLDQCYGLADGLASTHRRKDRNNSDGCSNSEPLLHADIKPANILCFTPDGGEEGPYTLKLSDFGLTKMVPGEQLSADTIAHAKTYEAPEVKIEDCVGLSYDIWGLGCLFLEFITWFIFGEAGVKKFENDRVDEKDDLAADHSKGLNCHDKLFKRVTRRSTMVALKKIRLTHDTERIIDKKETTRVSMIKLHHSRREVYCQVKDCVKSHIYNLKSDERVDEKLEKFLDLIEKSMLLDEPEKRSNAEKVRTFLDNLRRGRESEPI